MGKKDQIGAENGENPRDNAPEQAPDNIIKFRKRPKLLQVNIGIILFIFIALYLGFHFFTYMTKRNVAVYEVTQGTLSNDTSYKALIIRDETVVRAERSGSVDHYLTEGEKASINTLICSIDESGATSGRIRQNAQNFELSDESYANADMVIEEFLSGFSRTEFDSLYSLEDNMTTVFTSIYNDMAEQMLDAGNVSADFNRYYPAYPAVISYMVDGLEGLTADNFTELSFTDTFSKMTNLFTEDTVEAGRPLYKTINSETWYMIIKCDYAMAKLLEDEQVVTVHFKEDNTYANAYSSYVEKGGKYYGILRLNNSEIRYLTERYINIDIVLENETGLKIPNTSIITKEFFVIPEYMFMHGANSTDLTLVTEYLDDEGNVKTKAMTPNIYFHDDRGYFIDKEELPKGCKIIPKDSTLRYEPSISDSLTGAYNINKGYAVFKVIEDIYKSEDYTIIKTGTDYGLALYDHILLDATGARANQIVY